MARAPLWRGGTTVPSNQVACLSDRLFCCTARLLSTIVCLKHVVFASDPLDETLVCFLCDGLPAETPRGFVLSTLPSRALGKTTTPKTKQSGVRSDSLTTPSHTSAVGIYCEYEKAFQRITFFRPPPEVFIVFVCKPSD